MQSPFGLWQSDRLSNCHFMLFRQICPSYLRTQLSSQGSNTNYNICTCNHNINLIYANRTKILLMTLLLNMF